jgi:DNA-binding response OmpR family regulator
MSTALALIIEDDEDLSMIFAAALAAAQFKTEVIQDGNTAAVRLAATRPDVVVLDLHLPNISGRELLEQIRGDARLAHTRVMLASADALMAQSMRRDADLVLLKPVSFSQLRDLAKRLYPVEAVLD